MQNLQCAFDRSFKAMLTLSVAVLFAVCSSVQAKDKTQYSDREFAEALDQAVRMTTSNRVQTKKGSVDIAQGMEAIDAGWKVPIAGVWQVSEYSVEVLTRPAVIVNHGDRFEFTFYGQDVYPFAEGIRNHKGMVKAEKAWVKKYKDLKVEVGIDDDKVTLTGEYSYAKGVSKGDIASRLKMLFESSCGVMVWSYHAKGDVEKDYIKGLADKKIEYLTMVGLVYLFDDGLGDYFNEDLDAEEGNWFFTYEDRPVYIANQGRRVIFNYHYDVPEEVEGANREKVLDAAREFVAKNKIKLATSQEITWYDEEVEDSVWLTVTFEFDGSYKGKDFKKAYFEYYEKYTEKLEKAVEKAIDKNS